MSRPQMLRARVSRPRLIEALETAVQSPVTLVCAGAGWGKSVLVSAWAEGRRTPVAWLTVDRHDNDAQTFWSGVVATLQAAGAVPPGNPLAELTSLPADATERQRHLVRGLSRLRAPTVLVLDDFHEVDDAEVIAELTGLVRHPPRGLRLVVIGRREPALPLHRLRTAEELAEIRGTDLAFTAEEAADLFERHGFTLTSEDVTTLLERTEGWAAGLQLAAAFLDGPDGRRPVADFAGDVRSVDEYVADEVLAGQPAAVRRFLLHTSICEHLCSELADAITQRTDGQQTLEELERVNDFVVRLGAKPRWFRYHPLLRDVLRHRLLREFPASVPELHRRAARWYAAQKSIFEALEHAVAARDWPYVGHLVVTEAAPLILSSRRARLTKILQQVPPESVTTRAELMVCGALLLFHAGDYDAIPARLAGARELLRDRPDAERLPVEITLRALQVGVLRAAGDMPALVAETTQLLAIAMANSARLPSAAQYRAIALNNKGVGLLWTGRTNVAERYLWAASTAARAAGVELVEINATGHLALLEHMSGSLREAARLAGSALDLAERRGWLFALQTVPAHLAMALVHIERNELLEARSELQLGLRAHRADREAAQELVWLGAQARLALAEGEPARARAVLDDARGSHDHATRAPVLDQWLLLIESELDLRAGQPERVLARYADPAREASFAERVCAARAAFAVHDPHRAADLLAAPRSVMPETVATVESRILTALIADASRQALRAAGALAEALALAEREGIRQPFVSMGGGRLDDLIGLQILLADRKGDFAERILRAIASARGSKSSSAAGELSERETEVLLYLPTMLTAADIATELGVSVNTVKAHMRSIYRKLAAARRQEAVVIARRHGLL